MTQNSHRNLSQFEQFDVTHLENHATWFFSEYNITTIFEVVTDRFWSVLQFLYCLVDLLHLFFVFQDGILRYSSDFENQLWIWFFCSTGTSVSRIRFQMLLEYWLSVVSPSFLLFSSCTEVPRVGSPTPLEALSDCWRCCCGCCCSQPWRKSRCWGCFVYCSISFLWSYFINAISRHKIVYDYCVGFRLPKS